MLKELPTRGEVYLEQRKRLTDRHEKLMDKMMKANSHKSKYWILGMARTKRKQGRTTITPFLQAYDVQPEVTKEAYLYEVDNTAGTKTLIWVMHPNGTLSFPTLGKSIRVADESGVKNLAAEVTGVN